MRIPVAALLIASPFAFVFAGSSVAMAQNAQNCGGGTYAGYDPAPNESVTITAPRFQNDHQRLNTPPGRITMSKAVSFADLNLCTSEGARALRERVRQAASDICNELPSPYTHALPSDANCYRDALARTQPKVDFAIDNARGNR